VSSEKSDKLHNKNSFTLSALQICWYYLSKELVEFCSEDILKWCFAARIGLYFPCNFPTFDLFLPLRHITGNKEKKLTFYPILISVKTRERIALVQAFLDQMEEAIKSLQKPAIGLLFWLGSKPKSKCAKEFVLKMEDIDRFMEKPSVMCKLVVINQDKYGIHKLASMTSVLPQNTRALLSWFLPSLMKSRKRKNI